MTAVVPAGWGGNADDPLVRLAGAVTRMNNAMRALDDARTVAVSVLAELRAKVQQAQPGEGEPRP